MELGPRLPPKRSDASEWLMFTIGLAVIGFYAGVAAFIVWVVLKLFQHFGI